ncbi:MAG: transcriptional regulator, LysR family [Firmicutes bacterium]|nr:transcriptional regulator, LysR family [Bacillota bacterium]
MDDKDWLILKTIAEEKNITKAADRLYISQPALTYRLRNLEKEFAAKLVSRHPSGVILTPQGESVLAYAQEMLLQLRKTKERVQNMENKVQGTLRLGTSSVFAHYLLPPILKTFLEKYPDVEVSLYLTDSSLEPMIQEWWRESFSEPPHIPMKVDNMDTCRQMVLHGLGWAILPAIGLRQQGAPFTQELYWRNGEPLRRRTWMIYPTAALDLSAVAAFTEYMKKQDCMGQRTK